MSFKKFIILLLIITISSISISAQPKAGKGVFYTNKYHNLFSELLNKSPQEIDGKIKTAWEQLFYGDNDTARVYYPVGKDMAYIKDVANNDVRSEGMSYGMMIAVQLNKKPEFDRLWKWTKTYMQHKSGPAKNYICWHANPDGTVIDSNSASDGEEWIVTSLLFASGRWGDGKGIYNYNAEAQKILNAMLSKIANSNSDTVVTNMFNKKLKEVVFVPIGNADDFTDPSYHLPHYYELWARRANKNNNFWKQAAVTSRKFFRKAANPETGLMPDYANFDGSPANPFNGQTNNFMFDAWRAAANVAVDYAWFAKDTAEINICNRVLNFFYGQGVKTYGNLFTLDGQKLSQDHSVGLVAMNAVAAMASNNNNRVDFVNDLWEQKIPAGRYRYYDGLLYMMGMLHVGGNFRIY